MQVLEHKEPEEQLLWCSKCKVMTRPQSSAADSSCHEGPCTRCCMGWMSLMLGCSLQRMVPPRYGGPEHSHQRLQDETAETASAGSSAEKGHAASYQASQVHGGHEST